MALSSKEYLPIVADDRTGDEKAACCYCREGRAKRVFSRKLKFSIGCLAFAGVFWLGYIAHRFVKNSLEAPVWSTDFAPARRAVHLEQVRFSGSPAFDAHGKPVISHDTNQTRYTGLPIGPVDDAWDDLIGIRYFLISDQQALETWGPSYKQYYRYPDSDKHEGGYVAGVDVLHTLHCVNKLRKAIYSDQYPEFQKPLEDFAQYHIDHCIEILRQSVQCSGDLTPIPTRWWPGLGEDGRNFIDSDQVHTCRNFADLRSWTRNWWFDNHRLGSEMHPPPH